MKIAIGSDHGGFEMKKVLVKYLSEKNYDIKDVGIYDVVDREKCHYPLIAEEMGKVIASGECRLGILVCGTGIGISIAANKINGIRAARVCDHFDAKYSRLHNDANVLCLGGRTLGDALACEIADVFLTTEFSGSDRHQRRIDMVTKLENR